MDLTPILIAVAVALVAGGGAYLLARSQAARDVAAAMLVAGRQAVARYLSERPPTAAALDALIAGVYGQLPAAIRGRVSQAQFTTLVTPLLYQAEEALATYPPSAARALSAGGPSDA